jgi:hypothetical protein
MTVIPSAISGLAQPLHDLRLLAARDRRPDQHRHLGAEVSEQLRLLQRDIAAPDDEQRLREVVELHRRR